MKSILKSNNCGENCLQLEKKFILVEVVIVKYMTNYDLHLSRHFSFPWFILFYEPLNIIFGGGKKERKEELMSYPLKFVPQDDILKQGKKGKRKRTLGYQYGFFCYMCWLTCNYFRWYLTHTNVFKYAVGNIHESILLICECVCYKEHRISYICVFCLFSPEGIEALCSDLGVDHTDVRMLMLAWCVICCWNFFLCAVVLTSVYIVSLYRTYSFHNPGNWMLESRDILRR